MCYNALTNPRLQIGHEEATGLKPEAETRACPVGPDDGILRAAAGA
jgi:hypothetical protein